MEELLEEHMRECLVQGETSKKLTSRHLNDHTAVDGPLQRSQPQQLGLDLQSPKHTPGGLWKQEH